MSGLMMLDAVIGLVFVYLLLSLICTSVNEGIAAILSSRAKLLKAAIEKIISDPTHRTNFYNHPLISALAQKTSGPAYISARSFAMAVLDVVAPPQTGPHTLQSLRSAIGSLATPLEKAVLALADKGSKDLSELRQHIENWFNDSMERLSGVYKRKTQWILLALAALTAVTLNADTIAIAKALISDSALRTTVAAAADRHVKSQQDHGRNGTPTTFPSQPLREAARELGDLNLPIGWGAGRWPAGGLGWFEKILGLMISSITISMGAPFWFDILNRIMQFRASVKPGQKAKG
jgi:hypothetical protein